MMYLNITNDILTSEELLVFPTAVHCYGKDLCAEITEILGIILRF